MVDTKAKVLIIGATGFIGIYMGDLIDHENLVNVLRQVDMVIATVSGSGIRIVNNEEDIATFTLKAILDAGTENKTLHIRPKENRVSQRDIVTLWEKKIGHTLEKTVVSQVEVAKITQEPPFPNNIPHAVRYSVWVKGSQNFELASNDVEATELYPDVRYKTMSEYLDQFI
ncbi:hypothetical protein R1sor_009446 [Riccia sorocarpa]|uniref:NmrA-like domain-containing protein n=1 Tax=Riccia sorocarpa TaxID=122646 RepID=A0ABD3HV37_9MARC